VWRVGRTVGRTVYRQAEDGPSKGDELIGVMDTPALAELVVDAVNARLDPIRPEHLAQIFHEAYEHLAPDFGYKTREASAVPWSDVPEANKRLMVATAAEVLKHLT
jgi:hypothetical protein